jgi:peroxin-19
MIVEIARGHDSLGSVEIPCQYPNWLRDNRKTLPAAEYERYQKQYDYCRQIVVVYDQIGAPSGIAEGDGARKVMELMQKMQDCGQPPADILKDLASSFLKRVTHVHALILLFVSVDLKAPGLEMGDDGLPKLPEIPGGDCCIM